MRNENAVCPCVSVAQADDKEETSEEKVSGTNGTVEIGSARGLALA